MASAPDILVTAPDAPRTLLVVEAKFSTEDLAGLEPALKRYMVKMGVPVGLLVTPKVIGIYRDRYTGTSEKSVERIKLVEVPDSWLTLSNFSHALSEHPSGGKTSRLALAFEENVQSWLERLRRPGMLEALPNEAREAFLDHVIPALNEGIIRAAHPREYPQDH
jgi:hypothetical protein